MYTFVQIYHPKTMKMKKFHFLGAAAIAALLFLVSCKDPCKDLNCNNGSCLEGDCVCEPGYQGLACDVKHNAKFVGTYLVFENCNQTSNPQTYDITIAADPANPSTIRITNLYFFPNSTLIGVINGDGMSFSIASQLVEYGPNDPGGYIQTLSDATSTLDGRSINVMYEYAQYQSTYKEICGGIWTKK
jgi:hypothetical protein